MEYLGFRGDSFKLENNILYVEACDMADQVLVASGKDLAELKKNFKKVVDKFYDDIDNASK